MPARRATPTPSSSASTPTSTPRTTTCWPATSTSWSRSRRSGSPVSRPTSRTATITRPSSTFTYVGFPIYDTRFANPELRQAFSQAIDRQAIIDAIFNGTRVPAQSVVSPVVAGSREDACGELCEYDPAAAKQKYDAAGGFQGTLNLWFNSGAGHDQWMQAVANQLRQNLGIQDIVFEQKDFAEYLTILDAKQVTGPFRLGWVMDYPSPQNYLQPIYSTTGSSNNMATPTPRSTA